MSEHPGTLVQTCIAVPNLEKADLVVVGINTMVLLFAGLWVKS